MRVLVTGGHGELGRSLVARGAALGHAIDARGHHELDIGDRDAVARAVATRPDLVINAAAYTAVDRAEHDHDRAFAVNATGAGCVARACADLGVPLVHVSTDHVFDGRATRPYREDHPVGPVNVYGASKAEGERLVRATGATIVRTSWLVGGFAARILALADEHPVVRVVSDQHGCPTLAEDLADALFAISGLPRDTYHFCNAGPTTRHGLAVAIVEAARRVRTVLCDRIEAVSSLFDFAPRPAYAVLDTSRVRAAGIATPPWRDRIVV